ncbi:MAG: cytochrome b N-terminal domain-containing protein [Pseudomonadota bacterium]
MIPKKQDILSLCDAAMMVKRFFFETRWGAKSLVALYISVVSGIVVAWQYAPENPFYSASSLDLLIPFGLFWRSLHFYSSQIFFLLSIIHLLVILFGTAPRLSLGKWIWLNATMPVALLLLFTGYVLRGDATGESAGLIAENICLAIPVVGKMINSLLFAISEEGMKRVYANHVIGLAVLWVIFAWDHLRRYRVQVSEHGGLIVAILGVAVMWNAPMEPMQLGVFHISGPWFFLGLQELLRYVQPFWAGVVFPLFFLVAQAFLDAGQPVGRWARFFAGGWLFFYGIATLVALGR